MSDLVAKWEKIQTIQDFAFILSLDSVTMEVKGKMRDILKKAQLGQPAPNLELHFFLPNYIVLVCSSMLHVHAEAIGNSKM